MLDNLKRRGTKGSNYLPPKEFIIRFNPDRTVPPLAEVHKPKPNPSPGAGQAARQVVHPKQNRHSVGEIERRLGQGTDGSQPPSVGLATIRGNGTDGHLQGVHGGPAGGVDDGAVGLGGDGDGGESGGY